MAEKTSSGAPTPKTNVSGVTQREVPKVLHQVWLQRTMREEVADLTGQARRVATADGWEYLLWDDERLWQLSAYRGAFEYPRCAAHYSNLARVAILDAHGGLYLDADVELYRMPEGLTGEWMVENNNCAMASPPGGEFCRRLLREMGPEFFSGTHPQVLQFLQVAGGSVQLWPAWRWNGDGGRKSWGRHLGRSVRWASHVALR